MSFNSYTYLYVEDDALSREIMQLLMGTVMGVERLSIFPDSADFMQKLRQLPCLPDVIMLDIHMQPLTGFDLLTLIRAERGLDNTKVIALTASVMNEEVEKLRESGFDGAIAKPLSAQIFPTLIRQVLEGHAIWHVMEG